MDEVMSGPGFISYDIKEQHCERHGVQPVTHVFAGVPFCAVCIRDKLLELGLKPVHETVRTVTLVEKE
jgi:hypothetical protein